MCHIFFISWADLSQFASFLLQLDPFCILYIDWKYLTGVLQVVYNFAEFSITILNIFQFLENFCFKLKLRFFDSTISVKRAKTSLESNSLCCNNTSFELTCLNVIQPIIRVFSSSPLIGLSHPLIELSQRNSNILAQNGQNLEMNGHFVIQIKLMCVAKQNDLLYILTFHNLGF